MGRDKAQLAYRGQTFLENNIHTLRLSDIERIAVVLGHHADEIQNALKLEGVEVVINPDYRLGQTSSLQAGLRAVAAASSPSRSKAKGGGGDTASTEDELEAVVLALVDHPAVTSATVMKLVETFLNFRPPVVIPTYQGQRGHPAIIARALFPELLALGPDEGANTVVRKYRDQTRFVMVDDPGILLDVDDPKMYNRLQGASDD
ncbi:MAG: nucleotidyltransferase family protein [Acidobacteria bacterium]|nr:nucleotidyltransferase family protein [Acidobacteriota bacterium]